MPWLDWLIEPTIWLYLAACIKFSPGYCCVPPPVTCEICTDDEAPAEFDLTVTGTFAPGTSGPLFSCTSTSPDYCALATGTFGLEFSGTASVGGNPACTWAFNYVASDPTKALCPFSWRYYLITSATPANRRRFLSLVSPGISAPGGVLSFVETIAVPYDCETPWEDVQDYIIPAGPTDACVWGTYEITLEPAS